MDRIVSSLPADVTNRYMFVKEIGAGGEGVVYKATPTRPDGTEAVAVKVISGNSFDRCRAMVDFWRELTHPYVVSPRWVFIDNIERQCTIEMELLSIVLCDKIMQDGALSYMKTAEITGHLASALSFLHQRGIAHRDIKPENVFLRDGVAKLGDLGSIVYVHRSDTLAPSAAAAAASDTSDFKLTLGYAPPEYVEMMMETGRVTTEGCDPFAADMWSLGLTLWAAGTGSLPWNTACESECPRYRQFVTEGIDAVFPANVSPGFESLLRSLLKVDPSERATAADILANPWVTASPAPDDAGHHPATVTGKRKADVLDGNPSISPSEAPAAVRPKIASEKWRRWRAALVEPLPGSLKRRRLLQNIPPNCAT